MKKKVKIITHGNTWVNTSTPTICPECASFNVKEHTYNDLEWHGPFRISYSRKVCSCEDCNCRFKISRDKKSIEYVEISELSPIVATISGIIFLILMIISSVFWNDENPLPLPMIIAIITNLLICFLSLTVWFLSL